MFALSPQETELLTAKKVEYECELNKQLDIIKNIHNEHNVKENSFLLEKWTRVFSIAQQIDSVDYLLIGAPESWWEPVLYFYLAAKLGIYILILNQCTKNVSENTYLCLTFIPAICSFWDVLWHRFHAREDLRSVFYITRHYKLLSDHEHNVSNVFNKQLSNDYMLQKPEKILSSIFISPLVNSFFERNRQFYIAYLNDPAKEKQQIQNKIFWLKLNSEMDTTLHDEAFRFCTALEYFHTGKPAMALKELIDEFKTPYFQYSADTLISHLLFLLIPRVTFCSNEEKKQINQLINNLSKQQPDSAAFFYSAFVSQHPDRDELPIDWEVDIDMERGDHFSPSAQERRIMIKRVVDISLPLETQAGRKNNYFSNYLTSLTKMRFFSCLSKPDQSQEDETPLLTLDSEACNEFISIV